MPDQDVINILLQEPEHERKIKFLDNRWNVLWEYLTKDEIPVLENHRDERGEFSENPYIIHYSSDIKPWSYPEFKLAKDFWDIAKKSPFFYEILCMGAQGRDSVLQKKEAFERKSIQEMQKYIGILEERKHWMFPIEILSLPCRVVIYGYGDVGQDYFRQLSKAYGIKIVMVVDKSAERYKEKRIEVKPIHAISGMVYDYVIIAVASDLVSKEIKRDLRMLGVLENKMIWPNPEGRES